MRWSTLLVTWGSIACAAPSSSEAPVRSPKSADAASPRSAPRGPNDAWVTKLDADHALVGKIWDAKRGAFVTLDALVAELARTRFVLLGEKHDNPDHHLLQARVIAELVGRGRRPAVVLEMLEAQQRPALEAYVARDDATAAGFGAALGWEKTSWPPFAEYRPIMEAAFGARLPLVAGNLAQGEAKSLVKQGLAALPEARVKELRLDQALPAALEASLIDELRASHCGHLPEKLLAPMALAQRARDASLALALARAGVSDGAVLIAGGGHARRDRGVPYFLARESPGASVASLLFREVRRADVDAPRYLEDEGPFDYVWFTPRASDEDPCAAFGK